MESCYIKEKQFEKNGIKFFVSKSENQVEIHCFSSNTIIINFKEYPSVENIEILEVFSSNKIIKIKNPFDSKQETHFIEYIFSKILDLYSKNRIEITVEYFTFDYILFLHCLIEILNYEKKERVKLIIDETVKILIDNTIIYSCSKEFIESKNY